MNSTAEIVEQATVDGVILALSPRGTLTATGDQSAVDRWLPAIRQSKAEILTELQREARQQKVITLLEAAPSTRYAVQVADASADPVVVTVGIRKIATFELEIPQKYYDGMVLLELIEKHSGEKYANS